MPNFYDHIRARMPCPPSKEDSKQGPEGTLAPVATAPAGHNWEMIEPGPPGHDPPWGDWWKCTRCGAGCRHVGHTDPPPTHMLVFDDTLTCEEYREHPANTLDKVATPKGWVKKT